MRGGPAAARAGRAQDLEQQEPLRLDGDDFAAGQDELLRAQGGRVPEGRRDEHQGGQGVQSQC